MVGKVGYNKGGADVVTVLRSSTKGMRDKSVGGYGTRPVRMKPTNRKYDNSQRGLDALLVRREEMQQRTRIQLSDQELSTLEQIVHKQREDEDLGYYRRLRQSGQARKFEQVNQEPPQRESTEDMAARLLKAWS